LILSTFVLAFTLSVAAPATVDAPSPNVARVAIARLQPAEGSHVHGSVQFVEEKGGVRLVVNVAGLTPGNHGFHIHEKGDLSAPDRALRAGSSNSGNRRGSPLRRQAAACCVAARRSRCIVAACESVDG